jgi:hypothetical protein
VAKKGAIHDEYKKISHFYDFDWLSVKHWVE